MDTERKEVPRQSREKGGRQYNFEKLSPEQRRQMGAIGGRASGVARRRKRSLREAADVLLALGVKDPNLLEKLEISGLKKDDKDYQMALVVAMVLQAVAGDVKAARLIFDLVGKEPPREDRGVTILEDV